MDAFVQRPEFKNRYDALSNSAYVDALEANAEVTHNTARTTGSLANTFHSEDAVEERRNGRVDLYKVRMAHEVMRVVRNY